MDAASLQTILYTIFSEQEQRHTQALREQESRHTQAIREQENRFVQLIESLRSANGATQGVSNGVAESSAITPPERKNSAPPQLPDIEAFVADPENAMHF
jgi:hypothetical protein